MWPLLPLYKNIADIKPKTQVHVNVFNMKYGALSDKLCAEFSYCKKT